MSESQFVFDLMLPLGLHLSPFAKEETDLTPVEPICCLGDFMARLTLTRGGRLRVSVGRNIILDTRSEPSGQLYLHSRTKRILDHIYGPVDLGAGLRIKDNKPEMKGDDHDLTPC